MEYKNAGSLTIGVFVCNIVSEHVAGCIVFFDFVFV